MIRAPQAPVLPLHHSRHVLTMLMVSTNNGKINSVRVFFFLFFLSIVFYFFPVSSYAATIIQVPFTAQAPYGNWAEPWQDFCEEASVVMSAHFLWNAPLTPKLADTEMQLIKQYEQVVFKKYNDTSVAQTASILKNLYGFKNIETRRVESASAITNELSQGKIILVPAAGRMLQNPYFKAPGPLYHMIVIRGFDDAKHTFITNDPGTRKGNGYEYDQELLFRAIHDWNEENVMRGEKNVIIITK